MCAVGRYMQEHNISPDLQRRINQFLVKRVVDMTRVVQEESVEILHLLSDGLRGELRLAALAPKLEKSAAKK